jgi:hypothetical protein
MADATVPGSERERGRQIGLGEYRPDLYPSGTLQRAGLADLHAAGYMMLRAGLKAAVLDPPVTDLDAFLEGVLDGLREAHDEHRASTQSHAHRADCDPDNPWGMCEYCEAYAEAVAASRVSRARWSDETKEPEREFVVSSSGSKVHVRSCPAVTRMLSSAEAELERLSPADARHGGVVVRWPRLLNREEAISARRRRCGVCCPDLPDRPVRGPLKGTDGQFTAFD